MSPNELLMWMSARRSGSWAQFRSMVDDLGLRDDDSAWSYQRFRTGLARHGHASFGSAGGGLDWAVVPPVLAVGELDGRAVGVLCGARTRPLLDRLAACGAPVSVETIPNPGGVDVVRMFAPDAGALAHAAAQAGVPLRTNAVREALARILPVRAPAAPMPGGMPFGRDVKLERFVVERRRCRWVEAPAAVPQGPVELFRASRWQIRDYYLFVAGQPRRVDGQSGKFLVLQAAGRQVMRYDPRARRLRLPAICRPPLKLDQALTLCTGLPPTEEVDPRRGRPFLTYDGIAPDVAGLAGEILHQSKL